MLQQIFRKWWVILLQGILLIILSIYIFNNPVEVLAGISLWVGLLALATGAIGIIAWLVADKSDKEGMSLLWSIVTLLFGLLMLKNVLATMITINVLFGCWMIVTGIWLAQKGWGFREKTSLGWVIFIAGLLSTIAGVLTIFNLGVGAFGISIMLGLQVLLGGIALVVLSFVKKTFVAKISDRLETLRARI